MHKYTDEQLEYLRDGYKLLPLSELTEAFNARFGLEQSDSALRNAISKRGFGIGGRCIHPVGYYPERYTAEQIDFLNRNYQVMLIPELTEKFNKKFNQNRTPGGIRSALAVRKIKSGRKRGVSPFLAKMVGSERVCPSSGFVWIKLDEPDPNMLGSTRQRHKHIVVWEKANGPIPNGFLLRFLDGNKQNCTVDNLELFTRTESLFMSLMNHDSAPPELRETIRLTARLKAKVAERKRELLEAG